MVVDGAALQWAPVTSGVPQGSLLGPLLFTLFINDLKDEAIGGVGVALYADDTKLYKSVASSSNCLSLQDTLTSMLVWSLRKNIDFNASKCKTLSVMQKKTPLLHQYSMDGIQLERILNERDHGVTITSTLSWELHIQPITAKANKVLGLLKRTCPLLKDISVRRTLSLSLITTSQRFKCVFGKWGYPLAFLLRGLKTHASEKRS